MNLRKKLQHPLFWLLVCVAYLQTFAESLLHIIYSASSVMYIKAVDILQFSGVVYVPVMMFLLLRKHRAGWVLVFMHNFFLLTSLIFGLSLINGSGHIPGSDILWILIVLIRIALAYMLWRQSITDRYNVSEADMKQSVYFPLVLTPVIWVILAVVFVASGKH